jgi:hypothetical protein
MYIFKVDISYAIHALGSRLNTDHQSLSFHSRSKT